MRQWDTNQWPFPHGSHPCVIISPTSRCQNPDFETVNILACQSSEAARQPRDFEELLDKKDGLDWTTIVRCDFVWVARKDQLTQPRGSVANERRRSLGRKLIRLFGLWLD